MRNQPIVIDDSTGRSSRKRRRIRRVVLLALLCLPFAFVFSVAWPFLRPLTENERRLVGTWRNTTNPAVFTFHADRTITSPGHPPTTWCLYDDRLCTTEELRGKVARRLLGGNGADSSAELVFEDDDQISVLRRPGYGKHRWQRVKP